MKLKINPGKVTGHIVRYLGDFYSSLKSQGYYTLNDADIAKINEFRAANLDNTVYYVLKGCEALKDYGKKYTTRLYIPSETQNGDETRNNLESIIYPFTALGDETIKMAVVAMNPGDDMTKDRIIFASPKEEPLHIVAGKKKLYIITGNKAFSIESHYPDQIIREMEFKDDLYYDTKPAGLFLRNTDEHCVFLADTKNDSLMKASRYGELPIGLIGPQGETYYAAEKWSTVTRIKNKKNEDNKDIKEKKEIMCLDRLYTTVSGAEEEVKDYDLDKSIAIVNNALFIGKNSGKAYAINLREIDDSTALSIYAKLFADRGASIIGLDNYSGKLLEATPKSLVQVDPKTGMTDVLRVFSAGTECLGACASKKYDVVGLE